MGQGLNKGKLFRNTKPGSMDDNARERERKRKEKQKKMLEEAGK